MKILLFTILAAIISCTVVRENTYVYDSPKSDTVRISELDSLFDSVDRYREHIGAEPQDNILIRRLSYE